MNSHAYALEIENIIESVFNDSDNPLVCADLIEKYPYQYMIATLSHIYAQSNSDNEKRKIKEFDEKMYLFVEMSVGTILSFDSSTKIINGIEYTIDYKNGEVAIEKLIEDFKVLCNY